MKSGKKGPESESESECLGNLRRFLASRLSWQSWQSWHLFSSGCLIGDSSPTQLLLHSCIHAIHHHLLRLSRLHFPSEVSFGVCPQVLLDSNWPHRLHHYRFAPDFGDKTERLKAYRNKRQGHFVIPIKMLFTLQAWRWSTVPGGMRLPPCPLGISGPGKAGWTMSNNVCNHICSQAFMMVRQYAMQKGLRHFWPRTNGGWVSATQKHLLLFLYWARHIFTSLSLSTSTHSILPSTSNQPSPSPMNPLPNMNHVRGRKSFTIFTDSAWSLQILHYSQAKI